MNRIALLTLTLGALQACGGSVRRRPPQIDAAAMEAGQPGETAAPTPPAADAADIAPAQPDAVETSDAVDALDTGAGERPDVAPDLVPDLAVDLPGEVAPAEFPLLVRLVGQGEHAGTEVRFAGTNITAVTDFLGRFEAPGLGDGRYAVSLRNGNYEDNIPELIVRGGAAFLLHRDGERRVSMVEVPRGRRLVAGWTSSHVIVESPSDDRLLVATGRPGGATGLALLDSSARNPTEVARDVLLESWGPLGSWGFRDPTSVFFMRGGRGFADAPADLLTVPLSGGMPTTWAASIVRGVPPVFVLGGSRALLHRWSAVPRGTQLTLGDLDGKNQTTLGRDAQGLIVSPDGLWLAFSTSVDDTGFPREIKLTDLRMAVTRVVAGSDSLGPNMRFRADSRRLLYLTEGLSDVFSHSIAEGSSIALGRAESLVSSADGKFVVVQTTPGGPLIVVGTEGTPKREVPFSAGYAGSLSLTSFTPDNRYFIVANVVFNIETGVSQRINFDLNTEIYGYVQATRTVIFGGTTFGGVRRLSRFTLESTANPVVITERLIDARVSPSGAHLTYAERMTNDAPARLTVVDLTNGQSHAFAPGVGRPVLFAPDGSKIAFLDGL
ncbi:MAG TPA: hypothetical protein VGF45_18835, partial [Polyangia bacterium]